MEIVWVILSALAGFAAGYILRFGRAPGTPYCPLSGEGSSETGVLRQYSNFLNYDGTERGQISLEDKN